LDDRQGIDEPTVPDIALIELLANILEALDALELGGVPEAFRAASKQRRGTSPVEIQQIRHRAVFYAEALVRKASPVNDALEKVADKFGRSADAIDEWRELSWAR